MNRPPCLPESLCWPLRWKISSCCLSLFLDKPVTEVAAVWSTAAGSCGQNKAISRDAPPRTHSLQLLPGQGWSSAFQAQESQRFDPELCKFVFSAPQKQGTSFSCPCVLQPARRAASLCPSCEKARRNANRGEKTGAWFEVSHTRVVEA